MSVVKQEAFGIYTVTIELDPNSSPRISGGAPILLIVNEIRCSSHYPLSSFKYEKPPIVYKINRTTQKTKYIIKGYPLNSTAHFKLCLWLQFRLIIVCVLTAFFVLGI